MGTGRHCSASLINMRLILHYRFVDEGGNPDAFFGGATRSALRDNQAAKGKVGALECARFLALIAAVAAQCPVHSSVSTHAVLVGTLRFHMWRCPNEANKPELRSDFNKCSEASVITICTVVHTEPFARRFSRREARRFRRTRLLTAV